MPVPFWAGDPITLSGIDIVIVRTGVRATLLKSLALVLEGLTSSIEGDTTNSSRTTIVMTSIVGLEFDIHDF